MKNLKNSFSNDPHKDVISYLSGISNMEGGHLVIGVADGTLDIVGTDLSKFNFDSTSVFIKWSRYALISRRKDSLLKNS